MMFIRSHARVLQHPGNALFLNPYADSHCDLWKRKQSHMGSGGMLCYPERHFPACAQGTEGTWPHSFSHERVSAPACSPETCFYGEGGVGKLTSHCLWKANNSVKRADSPIKICTFFLQMTFLFSCCSIFPATVNILNNANLSRCYQQRGFTLLRRTILKVQITWPKDSPWRVSAVHYIFTLPNPLFSTC